MPGSIAADFLIFSGHKVFGATGIGALYGKSALLDAMPMSSKIRYALDRCSDDVARVERADGRRLRSDGGISPSTKEVIQSVLCNSGSGIRNVGY